MHFPNPDSRSRRSQTQRINRVVDKALQNADGEALLALLALATDEPTIPLCDRIARRATRLARQNPTERAPIIAARNRRVPEIYAHRTPKGWFSAWCDGPSITDAGGKRSGIGVILMDPHHEVTIAIGERAGALSPLAAELAALIAAVTTAVARGARCLRVHTDCQALVHLWQDRRGDDRLSTLRNAAFRLRRLQLRLILRRLNQSANSLARDAAQSVSSLPDDDGRLLSKAPP